MSDNQATQLPLQILNAYIQPINPSPSIKQWSVRDSCRHLEEKQRVYLKG
jgi:hypothetical protein